MKRNYNILGIGNIGCEYVSLFGRFPGYRIHKINNTIIGKKWRWYKYPIFSTSEEYEENVPDMRSDFFMDISGKLFVFLDGSEIISSITLRVLEQIKHCQISIVYIKPDLTFLSDLQKKQHNVVYNVLQEFVRSGVFEQMIIIDKTKIEEFFNEEEINRNVVETLNMINYFNLQKPKYKQYTKFFETTKINTIGQANMEENEERMFFELDNEKERWYYFCINENKIKNDKLMLKNIKEKMKNKVSDKLKINYFVYPTNYEMDYTFIVCKSSEIQK